LKLPSKAVRSLLKRKGAFSNNARKQRSH
jgi:hypothetical protein